MAAEADFAAVELACERGGRKLFSDLGFSCTAGGAIVLTGPNGSGKSSLLRLAAGLGQPHAGQLLWRGQNIHGDLDSHRARLHLIGYQDGIKPALNVAETMAFWISLAGGPSVSILTALKALGIGALSDTACRLLSSGQKRRLSLARLVASPRPLWLLDEPAVGLDVEAVAALAGLINQHRAEGGVAVIATHQEIDLPDAQHLSLADHQPRRTIDPLLAEIW